MPVESKSLWIALWVVIFVVGGSSLGLLSDVPNLSRLTHNSRTAIGVILSTNPNQHMSVTAQFNVDGRSYQREIAGYYYHVGDAVRVFYDVSHPNIFVIEEPRILLAKQLLSCTVASTALSTFLTIYLYFRSRRYRKRAAPPARLVPPRITLSLVFLGVIAGLVFHTLQNVSDARALISGVLVLFGSIILLARAWKLPMDAGWRTYMQSKVVGLGVAMAIIGDIIGLVD